MALNVISNFAANVAHRNLVKNDADASQSLAKLSSGTRVVSARDDAASLAIGSRLNAEVQAMKQANVNAGQAISMLQIADGAMARVSDILVRMKTLAVQAGSGQLSDIERGMLDTEYQSLLSEIDRIAGDTEFNGNQLVNGASSTSTVLNGQSATNNRLQAADGFASITFDPAVGDATFAASYDSSTNVLTVTNLTTGTSQGINIGSTAIAQNSTQSVRFDQVGATITLNAAFDKTTDITPTGSATTTGGSLDAATITISNATDNSNGDLAALASLTAAFDLTAANAASANIGGFTANAIDLSSVGTKNITLSNGSGANIELSFVVTNAFSNGNNIVLEADDLGTLVFGNAGTSSQTSFSFKLGTGDIVGVDTLSIQIDSINAAALSLTSSTLSTEPQANSAQALVSQAIDTLNTARANIGAGQNRLDFAAANLATAIENAEAARSNLLDLDVAQEMTNFTSKQILLQAGVSMLAQANQLPQNLLRLFQ